jgi:hypothetical protein
MRKLLINISFILILVSLLAFQCKKNNENTNTEDNVTTETESDKSKVDLSEMKNIIDSSTEINLEVFIAISVLKKNYIYQFENDINKLTEANQTKLIDEKNRVFFESLKYTEKEYNDYLQKNFQQVNQYIINHPEITAYFTTTN